MRLASRLGRRSGAPMGIVALLGASAAVAAVTGTYSGKTSQKQRVTLTISAGRVQNFHITILDRCPDGHILAVGQTYPPMTISNGKFGGSFKPAAGRAGEKSQINGNVSGRKVTGRETDTAFSPREGAFCHGKARFTLRHSSSPAVGPDQIRRRKRRSRCRVCARDPSVLRSSQRTNGLRAEKKPANWHILWIPDLGL